jgi:hypothetical protein
MLRKSMSLYEGGRSKSLKKYKVEKHYLILLTHYPGIL